MLQIYIIEAVAGFVCMEINAGDNGGLLRGLVGVLSQVERRRRVIGKRNGGSKIINDRLGIMESRD